MHAAYPLDRAQQIDATGKAPPAISGGFHEAEAAEPVRFEEGRGIAAEIAAIDLETQELQPVTQAQHGEEVAIGREGIRAARHVPPQAP